VSVTSLPHTDADVEALIAIVDRLPEDHGTFQRKAGHAAIIACALTIDSMTPGNTPRVAVSPHQLVHDLVTRAAEVAVFDR
jgi:hypothetical protein